MARQRRGRIVATGKLALMREPPAELILLDPSTVRERLARQLEEIIRKHERRLTCLTN